MIRFDGALRTIVCTTSRATLCTGANVCALCDNMVTGGIYQILF
jgi:hypothetical protein